MDKLITVNDKTAIVDKYLIPSSGPPSAEIILALNDISAKYNSQMDRLNSISKAMRSEETTELERKYL